MKDIGTIICWRRADGRAAHLPMSEKEAVRSLRVLLAAIQIRDLPGGMILILLTFFAALFAFVWATREWGEADSGTLFFVALGLVAAGGLMLISAVFIVTFIRSINK